MNPSFIVIENNDSRASCTAVAAYMSRILSKHPK